MIILHNKITQQDINDNPLVYYLVPDNDKREWREFIGENVLTLRCRTSLAQPWTDSKFEDNILKIKEDVQTIRGILKKGGILILSRALLGDGMDVMQRDCPRTYAYLSQNIHTLVERFNNEGN